jgi:hypothetical protein
MAGTEQDDEVANCSERLNKGAMVKKFNSTAVFEEALPKDNGQITRSS